MRALLERIARLSPESQRRLAQSIEKEGGAFNASPLSFAQERLWFLDRLSHGSATYNIPAAVRFSGLLDLAVMAASRDEIVRRHESLRTVFSTVAGKPIQLIEPHQASELPVVDLEALPPLERKAEARRLATEESQRPFDLTRGPVMRMSVLHLASEDHVVLLTMHHIVSDGWSVGIFIQEFAALYQAGRSGAPSPLPALRIQYKDFARWQRRWFSPARLEAEVAHWKRRLKGAPPLLELCTDRPRPPVQTFRGAMVSRAFPAAVRATVADLSARRETTVYMTLLSAFATLLFHDSRQADMVLGTVVANRTRDEVEGLIGFFVNTLALRIDLAGDPTLSELLGRVREVTLEAFSHQDLPFEKLVEAVQPERSLDRSPIFQVGFDLQNLPETAVLMPELEIRSFGATHTVAKFDLRLSMREVPGALMASIEYNTDLFDATTMIRMLGHLEMLLTHGAADPHRRLSALGLLRPAQRHQVVREWNDTRCAEPPGGAHTLFEAQAARTPDAVAVTYGERELTYRTLDERADQLASHLLAGGLAREARVGLFLETSCEMIVAILGVLKAGGAYLPMDPGTPADRLAFMAVDARIAVILTTSRLQERLPPHDARVVCLDSDWPRIAEAPALQRPALVTDEQLAYVIYTSGSTGRPKGVELNHRGLGNLSAGLIKDFGQGPQSRVLQFSFFNFDASVVEIFMALLSGGRLHLAPRNDLIPGPQLTELLREQRVTTLVIPPSALAALPHDELPELTTLLVAGEACSAELVARWARGERFVNAYGPTEATVCATFVRCLPGRGQPGIGYPIANVRTHVLDARGGQVPIGVHGELGIGGVSVGRGYLGRPRQTAEKLVPDPFGERPGARLYRTGDVVRHRLDGSLDYLGRIDHQVKLRGFRIELGEIEAVLGEHPAVHHGAVVVREDRAGGKRLVAYVVATREGQEAAELKELLQAKLPGYMVPASYVFLDELPRTPSGKLDLAALPDPSKSQARLDAEVLPPRTELERSVAAIWQEVLEVEKVGVDDNFFELGGHSLLLALVQERLQESLGVEVKLLELFSHSTVGALAAFLKTRGEAPTAGEPGPATAPAAAAHPPVDRAGSAVAVVGMSLRAPGSTTLEGFWQRQADGVESIRFFTDEELLENGADAELLRDPRYVKAGSAFEGKELFDAAFFGINDRQASIMDPQQRIFLEVACEALEHAGYAQKSPDVKVGIYAGAGANTYILNLYEQADIAATLGLFQIALGNDKDHLATRVSYSLDLEGPSVTVQTACSTSLVATHLACRSLLDDECDLALAGGVSISAQPATGYLWQEGGIGSPDGHCRAFDAAAQGVISGSGAGVVVLKRLADALRDRDTIHAVILGSAINNDGSAKVGYTAPRIESQEQVILAAHARAGVRAEDIHYVEAHGTGTELGDPIEIEALTRAFRATTRRRQFCAVSSLKTSLGHLDSADGVAGLIRAVLAIRHAVVPPNLHFERPNPKIDLENSPFYVTAESRPWETDDGKPRRAGVSSFGIGGTNAHVVLEEAPDQPKSGAARPLQLLLLSAKTASALQAASDDLATHLRDRRPPGTDDGDESRDLANVAYTLQVGRRRFAHRRMLVCQDRDDAVAALTQRDPERVVSRHCESRGQSVTFLFPGQGTQYPGMGRELYDTEAVFRDAVDLGAEHLRPILGLDLRTVVLDRSSQRLVTCDVIHPAIFLVEYALARLWTSWLGEPAAMTGYSLGEYVAACLAGVFSPEAALDLIVARGRLMDATPAGTMLAVPLAEEEVFPLLDGSCTLAAVNGVGRVVVSGPVEAVEDLAARLAAQDLDCRRLHTAHGFHSAMMDPILEPFADEVRKIERHPPKLPYVSNLTGTWITAEQATDDAYWVEHLRRTVRFGAGLETLWRSSEGPLLEVGPGTALTTLARQHPDRPADREVISSMRHPKAEGPDVQYLLNALGRLWLSGLPVDWEAVHEGGGRRRVPLPTYPFERRRFWVDARPSNRDGRPAARSLPFPTAAERFQAPSWMRAEALSPPAAEIAQEATWLVFGGDNGLGRRLVERLSKTGSTVVDVRPGTRFAALAHQAGPPVFTVRPEASDDYAALFRELEAFRSAGQTPATVLHLWSAEPPTSSAEARPGETTLTADFEHHQDLGLRSLLAFAAACAAVGPTIPCRVGIVSSQLHEVTGGETARPAKATVLGVCGTTLKACPALSFHNVDVCVPPAGSAEEETLAERILAELAGPRPAPVIAYRGRHRWAPVTQPARLHGARPPAPLLRQHGAYLILGATTDVGFGFARFLAREAQARIAVAEPDLPPREHWQSLLAADLGSPGSGGPSAATAAEAGRLRLCLRERKAQILALEEELAQELRIRPVAAYEGLKEGLDRLCSSHALAYLRQRDVDLEPGRVHDRVALRQLTGIQPPFEKLYRALLAMLAEDGLLVVDGEKLVVSPKADELDDPDELGRQLEARYPQFRGLLRLLAHCTRHYGPALSGEMPAIEVLFPEGRGDLLHELERDTVSSNHQKLYVETLARTLAGAAAREGSLRILEVGAGSGVLTRAVMAALAGIDVEYCFSDIGRSFVRAAEREATRQGRTDMSFRVFDISRDAVAQGFEQHSFDVVLGLNVVHATPRIGETLANLKQLIVPGGLLGLIETVEQARWIDMTWGLAAGWWHFEDEELRTMSPLLPVEDWERVLRQAGYENVTVLPEKQRGTGRDTGLLLAQQAAAIADEDVERHLATRGTAEVQRKVQRLRELETLGAQVVSLAVDTSKPQGIARAVKAARHTFDTLHGIFQVAASPVLEGASPELAAPPAEGWGAAVSTALVLDACGAADSLDLAVLSTTSPPGGERWIDRAANAFLGAFARQRELGQGRTTRFLRWPEGAWSADDAEAALPRLWENALPELVVVPDRPAEPEVRETPPAARETVTERAGPASEVERRILGLFESLLGSEEIGRHDNFFELGGDSLLALSLTAMLRDAFEVDLPLRRILEAPSVASLAKLVADAQPSPLPTLSTARDDLPPTVVEIQAGCREEVPLFMVHATGASILCYYDLARHLEEDQPVYALEPPGMEEEDAIVSRLEELAAHHRRAMQAVRPEGPYLIAGWSAGGTVAFEIARQLTEQGHAVPLVALIDTYAPGVGDDFDELKVLMWQVFRFKLEVSVETLAALPGFTERLAFIVERARASGVLPPHIPVDQARRLLTIEISNLKAILEYQPGPYRGALDYFRSQQGTDLGPYEDLFPFVNEEDHAVGWGRLTRDPVTIHDVPGNHSTLMSEPHVRVLGDRLKARIAAVSGIVRKPS